MSIEFEPYERLNNLKQSIETATGESYEDLTGAVKGVLDRYEQSGAEKLETITITTATTDAEAMYNAFKTFLNTSDYLVLFFNVKESNTEYRTREPAVVVLSQTGVVCWVRNNGDKCQGILNAGSNYEAFVNVGDTYRKVVLL